MAGVRTPSPSDVEPYRPSGRRPLVSGSVREAGKMKIANRWMAANRHIGQSPIAVDIERQIDVHWGECGLVCFDFEELPQKFLGIRLRQQEARRCVNASLAAPCDRAWEKDRFAVCVRVEPDSVGAILTRCACALTAPAMRPLTPRLVRKALPISNQERLRWTKDGRLPQSGSVSIRRAQPISVPTYAVHVIEALLAHPNIMDRWRLDDARAAA